MSPANSKDPVSALTNIEKADNNAVYILLDFHECYPNPTIKRKLRVLAQTLKYSRKSIIVTSPSREIPEELKDVAVSLELPLPNTDELEEILDEITETPGVKMRLSEKEKQEFIYTARGLTALQARRIFSRAVVKDGHLDHEDISLVIEEKKAVIKESEALEYFPSNIFPDMVGGLDVLKNWVQLRAEAFSKEARDYGLEEPRGVALLGIPGTGKSMSAKMIAAVLNLPLFKFDVGAVYGPLLGQSEERIRKALKIAETVSPCVLWIDEIEKALSYGTHDSGTSNRVFGTVLTWMQERRAPCFVVGTANDVSRLPPELLRKGRFDEIFFIDLPTQTERESIFEVHLQKRKRNPEDYDLFTLAGKARGFTGAEIEQSIIDAMVVAFNEKREFTTHDILKTLERQVPLSVSQKDQLAQLQKWLDDGRAQPASNHGDAEREKLNKKVGFEMTRLAS